MRSRIRRQIGSLLDVPFVSAETAKALAGPKVPAGHRIEIPAEFTPRQYAVLLLHIAAAIEHALMVEYLYAGFSLCGPQLLPTRQVEVAEWQETILGIAKEEM